MALRVMYDSANMDAIPATATIVAGYPHRGGDTIWNPGRFPRALVVAIDQRGDHPDDCHAADVEGGDVPILVSGIRQWVTSWHLFHPAGLAAQGGFFQRPVVYCNLDTLPSVQGALHGLTWDPWVAAWPGPGAVLEPGWAAHQYASQGTGSGGDYDLSVVSPLFGVRPAPPPPTVGARIRDLLLELEQDATELAALARLLP